MTILTYHAVDPLWTGALSVHPAPFEAQIAWLVSHRRVVPLTELLDRCPDGVSNELVALTFDDGFSSVVQHALPVLARSDVPFTVFLIAKMYDGSASSVDWVDRPPGHPLRTLDPSEIRRLRSYGASFGSHSYVHADMTTLGYDAALADLVRSRDILEELLGEDVTSLAYPRGRHDDDVRRAAAAAGFTSAFGLAVAREIRGAYALPRVGIYPPDTGWSLRLKTAPVYGRLRASPRYHSLRRRIQRH
ncbi:MAG TPA: polysaccharide deacetylase family protein [Actinomycetota bacterium]|nr:polysaccharide deacetylase family protein [Actinomycetota bacterium]